MYLKIVYEILFLSQELQKFFDGMKIFGYVWPINLTLTKWTEPNNSNKIL